MNMQTPDRIQFRPGERLGQALARRRRYEDEPWGQVTRRQLDFYFALLAHGLREIERARFTLEEAMLIVDACNGWYITPEAAHLIWAEVAEAMSADALDEKWGVDGDALLAKLRDLSPAGLFALADLVQQFFGSARDIDNVAERLRHIGFPVTTEEEGRSDL